MKKLIVPLAGAVAFVLTMVASAGAASASTFVFYEPEVPEKLRR